MGKLSRGCQDQGYIDSGLLSAQWHSLFPVPTMVQETCQWSEYRVLQRIEGMPEIHKLRAFEDAGRETGGLMLAITGATSVFPIIV